MTLRMAVFASGSGSNFEVLAESVRNGSIPASIELLVCDKKSAHVLQRAEAFGVETYVFDPKSYECREDYERVILQELQRRGIDLIVLAGYMRLVTPVLLQPYEGKMINVHPALLPAFAGINAVRQALDYGVRITGATVHFVDGGTDTGPILAQQAVEVLPEDTEESLAARIRTVEHELLPRAVRWIAAGRVKLQGRTVTIQPE